MAHLPQFNDADFESQVLSSVVPVLVEFGAAWCPPCRAMEPHLEAVAEIFSGRLKVGTMDADHNTAVPARFNIRGVPTMILFKSGKPVGSVVGAVPRSKLEALFLPHL